MSTLQDHLDKRLFNLTEEMDNVSNYTTTRDGIRKILDTLLATDDEGIFDEITDVLDKLQADNITGKKWLLIEID